MVFKNNIDHHALFCKGKNQWNIIIESMQAMSYKINYHVIVVHKEKILSSHPLSNPLRPSFGPKQPTVIPG